MIDLTLTELTTTTGGLECRGLWIGTNDGLYGFCIGHLVEN